MRISEHEIEQRKHLFSLTDFEINALSKAYTFVEREVDSLVYRFYELQTANPEIALLIGDADTLSRLGNAMRSYVLDLFSGVIDVEYVNNRLRIGLVHKRIGVEPKLYLSAVYTLKQLLVNLINSVYESKDDRTLARSGLEKLLQFDITLVFDTYIRSLVSEIEISREKSEQYAHDLEQKVRDRTRQLEELSRTDPMTGLLNYRHMNDMLISVLRAAQRRSEPVSFVYMDINDFKIINDTEGHQKGDDILRAVATSVKKVSRAEDSCFRYGGDEFCVILPNCSKDQAEQIYVDRLQMHLRDSNPDLSLSIGVAQTGPDEYLDPFLLIKQADDLMYQDKRRKKMKVVGQSVKSSGEHEK